MARNQMMAPNQFSTQPQAYNIQQPKRSLGKKIKEGLFGAPGQLQQLPTQSPQQQQLSAQTIQNVLQMLQGGSTAPHQFDFGKIKESAQNRFQTETLPSIAERFTALGSGGSQGSSAFAQAVGREGTNLDRDLGAMEAQFGMQQQGQDRDYLLNLLKSALMPQFENQYKPATGGLFGSAAQGVGQGIGNFGGSVGGLSALKYLGFL